MLSWNWKIRSCKTIWEKQQLNIDQYSEPYKHRRWKCSIVFYSIPLWKCSIVLPLWKCSIVFYRIFYWISALWYRTFGGAFISYTHRIRHKMHRRMSHRRMMQNDHMQYDIQYSISRTWRWFLIMSHNPILKSQLSLKLWTPSENSWYR